MRDAHGVWPPARTQLVEAAIQSIAGKIGCTAETLRRSVRRAEHDSGLRTGLTSSDRERLTALERENREPKRAKEILRKTSAFFAQAEIDRRAPDHPIDVLRD